MFLQRHYKCVINHFIRMVLITLNEVFKVKYVSPLMDMHLFAVYSPVSQT